MRNDDSVLGAPFQMVEYVPGRVVRHADELEALGDKDTISDCVHALIRVLADLHAVDTDAVGLGAAAVSCRLSQCSTMRSFSKRKISKPTFGPKKL